jgi:IS5 family transposase
MTLFGNLCQEHGLTYWRQWRYHLRKIRTLYRQAQKVTHSTSSNPQKQARRREELMRIHQCYTDLVESYFRDVRGSFVLFRSPDLGTIFALREIDYYIRLGDKLLDLVRRRVINGEKIPHHEKIFSIFEPHTEWICKGKAGVPQELGLRVSIVEDQYGFILHHRVMEQQTDQEVAVELIRETKERFVRLFSCSFDKGFWSPHNKEALAQYLSVVALRKKGRPTQQDAKTEQAEAFKAAQKDHPAVESGINALENHGLDRCVDHGLNGFKRYVALAIVARNVQRLGHLLQGKEYSRLKRKKKIQATLRAKRLLHAV